MDARRSALKSAFVRAVGSRHRAVDRGGQRGFGAVGFHAGGVQRRAQRRQHEERSVEIVVRHDVVRVRLAGKFLDLDDFGQGKLLTASGEFEHLRALLQTLGPHEDPGQQGIL